MNNIIDRLRLDHTHFRTLLASLETVLNSAEDGNLAAIDQLYCILDYLTEYPEQIHHPTEDVLFTALKEYLTQQEWSSIEQNLQGHAVLEKVTADLLKAVDRSDPDFKSIRAASDTYISAQLSHLGFEENELFPLAERALQDLSPGFAEQELAMLEDPLFDSKVARFEILFDLLDPESDQVKNRALAAAGRYVAST